VTVGAEVNLSSLRVFRDRSLGRGGSAAALYRCSTAANESLLFKEYRPEIQADIDETALSANITWRRELSPRQRGELDLVACWPRAAVMDRSKVVGVLLTQAPGRFFEDTGTNGYTPRDFSALARDSQYCAKHAVTHFPAPRKLSGLGHLFEVLAMLHNHGVVYGDLQFKNVLTTGGPGTMSVYLLDCDGALVNGRSAFRRTLDPETWRLPGTIGFSRSSDLYKAALATVRCLAERPEWSPGRVAPRLDDMSELLPREDLRALVKMLSHDPAAQAMVTAKSLSPMASAWRQLVSESGKMYRRNDRFAMTPWDQE
jgi:hypothetical protein